MGMDLGVASARASVERGHTVGTGSAAAAFEDTLGRVASSPPLTAPGCS